MVFSEVFLLKSNDRASGVPALMDRFGLGDYSNKTVAIKANYNSADPFPASTHIDTLRAVVQSVKNAGASNITMGERSGMGDTREVLRQMGVLALAKEIGFETVVLDDLEKDDWVKFEHEGTHWVEASTLPNYSTMPTKSFKPVVLKRIGLVVTSRFR